MVLTQDELKRQLSYNPLTGDFIWLVRNSSQSEIGRIAGSVDKSHGYRLIHICGRKYLAQRLAWLYVYGEWPENDLDHKDRIKSNNAILNLRNATAIENGYNRSINSNNSSGFKAISWCSHRNKWRVRITIAKKRISLGRYSDINEAAKAYAEAALKYHGEFAHL